MPDIERLTAALADRYAIERQIGQGGMATVYLAEDLKHHRKVAVKVLRPELAAVLGGDRFLKEIEVTANLQHPNILPLFDSGVADGFLYYVMPFIEGESLRDRLDREKQLPVNDVVEIASEVAGALDYAHRHGVIHRDIKPENILLHEGRALVADFGIALAVTQAGGTRITETGLSLGTPDYMSPEQATADRDLDGRSDVYSLGAVTYEMLTGDPPHTANTVRAIIAKIVSDPPAPIGRTRSTVPPNVDAAVQAALAKSPADRFPTAARFATALSDPGYRLPTAGTAVGSAPGAAGWRHRVAGPLVVVAAVLLMAALWGWLRQPQGSAPVIRYALALPDAERLVATPGPSIAVSPDGDRLVYVGPGEGGRQLWLRERDQLGSVPLPGTEGAWQPFFAPDGDRVAFITEDRQLKVVPLAGGPPLTLVDSAIDNGGGSWGADGYVYVTSTTTRGLVRVHATGGSAPEPVTQVSTSLGVDYHVWPQALPNGEGVLFTILRDHLDDEVAVVDLATGEHEVLVQGELAWYLPTGHLLYVHPDGAMLATPFDQDQLRVTGPPVLLGTLHGFVRHDLALSASGRLVWVRRPAPINQVVWVDRQGVETPVDPDDPVTGIRYLALSPDGRWLAVNTRPILTRDDGHVWIKELPRGP
ncbi:MAG: protein kinase, partial [Gemmatimonadales bacterium]